MSIFEAMERLAGATLLALAPALQVAVSPQHRARGMDLAAMLRDRGQGDLVDSYVGELTREIWVGAETRSLPQEALELHFRELADIVAAHPPGPAHLKGIADDTIDREQARQLAVDLYLKARTAGVPATEKLTVDVSLFILQRSFAYLLREPDQLRAIVPLLTEFVSASAAETPEPTIAPARDNRQTATLARIREKYGISEAAEARLLALIDSQGATGDARLARLESLAAWLLEARGQLMRPTNDDSELRQLKTRAAEALAAGDLALAMETLKHVRRALRDGRRRIEARLEDEVAALKGQMTEEARAAARLAELAAARRDYMAAADLYFEAADCLPKSARDEAWRYHLARADVLLRKAEEMADDVALGEALAGYGGVLKLVADGSNARGAALANIGLGRALYRQAERGAGTARLADAIATLRKATALISADDDPALWCEAHGALARSLSLSGQRARQAQPLRDAVECYRTALAVSTEETPVQRLTELRIGLGSTLMELADLDKTANAVEDAVAAFTDALSRMSREDAPETWADVSFQLGSALLTLAETNRDPKRLAASVEALTGAVEVMTIDRDREAWITATMTLADALAALAGTEGGNADRLRAAVATYQRVLEVVDRATAPISWATASMNLGSALIRLGEHEDKRNNWLAAAAAMVPALEVFEAEGATAHADLARRTLKRFHEEWVGLLSPPVSVPVSAPVSAPLSKTG